MGTSITPTGQGRQLRRIGRRAALYAIRKLAIEPSSPGIGTAQVFTWAALGPSMLPRTWWSTAITVATAQTTGYVAGSTIGAVIRYVNRRLLHRSPTPDVLWLGINGLLLAATTAQWVRSLRHQRTIAALSNKTPLTWRGQAGGVLSGTAAFATVLTQVQLAKLLYSGISIQARRALPAVAVPAIAGLLSAGVTIAALDRLVIRRTLENMAHKAARLNELIPSGRTPPTSPLRSASPDSLENWSNLGNHGRAFVADGPHPEQIATAMAQFSGDTAPPEVLEPIRCYAGLAAHGHHSTVTRSLEDSVALMMDELHRTDAFSREHLLLVVTTGTGWVLDWSVNSFEFLTHGNCATASLQYSYLPSALEYLTDRDTPAQAGRKMLAAVQAHLDSLPADAHRPKLYLNGESLGSYGAQASFATKEELLAAVDGAIFSGTPEFTALWRRLTRLRDRTSPQVAPVIDGGRNIRFATTAADLISDRRGMPFAQDWEYPRVVYLQHASDPIVWWSPSLLYSPPDWLREKAGDDITQAMRWKPGVTFWQVGADQLTSTEVPGGHGHNYHHELLYAWASVLGYELPTEDELNDPDSAFAQLLAAVEQTCQGH